MVRAVGFFGFAAGFVIISPSIREVLLEGAKVLANLIVRYQPYSYVAGALLVLGSVGASLLTGQRAR